MGFPQQYKNADRCVGRAFALDCWGPPQRRPMRPPACHCDKAGNLSVVVDGTSGHLLRRIWHALDSSLLRWMLLVSTTAPQKFESPPSAHAPKYELKDWSKSLPLFFSLSFFLSLGHGGGPPRRCAPPSVCLSLSLFLSRSLSLSLSRPLLPFVPRSLPEPALRTASVALAASKNGERDEYMYMCMCMCICICMYVFAYNMI